MHRITTKRPATNGRSTLANGALSAPRARATWKPANEADVVVRAAIDHTLYELRSGELVEKTMGFYESRVAAVLIWMLQGFVMEHDLGIILGPDALLRLAPGLVRLPDVCFFAWDRFPNRQLPNEPIVGLAPDLAVEIISQGNTETEMQAKLEEYFAAGVRLVWYVYPDSRTVRAYSSPDRSEVCREDDCLPGGDILPGFSLLPRDLFNYAGHRAG